MGTDTKIAWCHHTWNPWRGCTKISAGCANCYAEKLARRNPAVLGYWGADKPRVVASEKYWQTPLRWNDAAWRAGERRRVFLGSMMDFLDDYDGRLERHLLYCWTSNRPEDRGRPFADPQHRLLTMADLRERVWDTIAKTPHLDWLILTKRPENFQRALPWTSVAPGAAWPHVWPGTTVEDQAAAEERIPELVRIPAALRFLSLEPLLEDVDIYPWLRCPHLDLAGVDDEPLDSPSKVWRCTQCGVEGPDGAMCDRSLIDWVIVGGESGPDARPMHPDWVRRIRDQCQAADVAFFFKQWGEWSPVPPAGMQTVDTCVIFRDGTVLRGAAQLEQPQRRDGEIMFRVGKTTAGRLLDGREWNQFPRASSLKPQVSTLGGATWQSDNDRGASRGWW